MDFTPKYGKKIDNYTPTVDTQPTVENSFGEKASNVLDTVFGGGKVGEAIGTEIARGTFGKTLQKMWTGRELSQEESKSITQDVTGGQVLGSALQSASLFLPLGRAGKAIAAGAKSLGAGTTVANIAGGIGAGASAGSTFGLGSGLAEGKSGVDLAKEVGVSAGIGAAVPAATIALGATSKFIGRALKGTGEALYKTSFDATQRESEQLLKFKAKYPLLDRISANFTGKALEEPITRADTAFRKGIKGTETMVGVQAKRLGDNLYQKILPKLQSSKELVTKDEMFAPIIKRINETIEPGKKQSLIDAFSAIQDDYKNIDSFDLLTANKVKTELDKFTPQKIFNGKEVANEYRTLANDMANAIRKKTYESLGGKTAKRDYLDLSNLIKLEQVGVKAISEAGFKGGSGGFITSMWNMATTPIKTVGGRVLYRVGNTFEFLGDKGIKTFGDFLTRQKIKKPISPGDRLLDTKTGKKIEQSVVDYVKNPKAGLSMVDVTKNNPLYKEARKYKTAEDFIAKYKGSATQYGDYSPEIRKFGLGKGSFRITDKGIDPNLEVTIYRGVPNPKTNKIIDGDFVTTDRISAESYAGRNNVVSKKVKAKDLIYDDPSNFDPKEPFFIGAEFVYSDSKNPIINLSESELKKIWQQANK